MIHGFRIPYYQWAKFGLWTSWVNVLSTWMAPMGFLASRCPVRKPKSPICCNFLGDGTLPIESHKTSKTTAAVKLCKFSTKKNAMTFQMGNDPSKNMWVSTYLKHMLVKGEKIRVQEKWVDILNKIFIKYLPAMRLLQW